MRWLRLISALLSSNFRSKLKPTETYVYPFRVWFTDIDVSVMNHAAILTVMEAGRIDAMVRSNFFRIAMDKKWFFPSQALMVQYYKPLKIFQKAKVYSKITYVDDTWIYIEQSIIRKGRVMAACVTKNTIRDGRKIVSTEELMNILEVDNMPKIKYDFIKTFEKGSVEMNERLGQN